MLGLHAAQGYIHVIANFLQGTLYSSLLQVVLLSPTPQQALIKRAS